MAETAQWVPQGIPQQSQTSVANQGPIPPQVPKANPNNNLSWFLWALAGCGCLGFFVPILVVIAIVAISPAAILKQAQENAAKTATSSAKTATSSVNTNSNPTNANINDWLTYINTKYKYSFQYPKTVELVNGAGGVGISPKVDANTESILVQTNNQNIENVFSFGVNSTVKSLSDLETELKSDKNNINFLTTKVGGYDAISFLYYGATPTIETVKDGNIYEFDITNEKLTNSILATFKFL